MSTNKKDPLTQEMEKYDLMNEILNSQLNPRSVYFGKWEARRMKHNQAFVELKEAGIKIRNARAQINAVKKYYDHIDFNNHEPVKNLVHDLIYAMNVLDHLDGDLEKLELINVDPGKG